MKPGADPILIVEDKESLRSVLRKTLEAEGFEVGTGPSLRTGANDSKAARKITRKHWEASTLRPHHHEETGYGVWGRPTPAFSGLGASTASPRPAGTLS